MWRPAVAKQASCLGRESQLASANIVFQASQRGPSDLDEGGKQTDRTPALGYTQCPVTLRSEPLTRFLAQTSCAIGGHEGCSSRH